MKIAPKEKTKNPTSRIDLQAALSTLREANRVLVLTHQGPDGDAIGSALAVMHLLHALGKSDVVCACEDPVPKIYTWVPGADQLILGSDVEGPFELVVITDVADLNRTGIAGQNLPDDQEILVLDHHLEERPCGTLNYIDSSYASASEIVLDLYDLAGIRPSKDAAACIYVGLSTDTGGFRYSNTDARAHRHASALLEIGVDVADISARVFDAMSIAKAKLLRLALDRMEYDAAFAHTYVTYEDLELVHGSAEDVEGLVNYARYIDGVEVGAFFRSIDSNRTKISLRSSKAFNSAALLKTFGGGGHAAAAGATVDMPLDEFRTRVCDAIHQRLNELAREKAS